MSTTEKYSDVQRITARLRGGPRKEFWLYRDERGRLRDCKNGKPWNIGIYTEVCKYRTGQPLTLEAVQRVNWSPENLVPRIDYSECGREIAFYLECEDTE